MTDRKAEEFQASAIKHGTTYPHSDLFNEITIEHRTGERVCYPSQAVIALLQHISPMEIKHTNSRAEEMELAPDLIAEIRAFIGSGKPL